MQTDSRLIALVLPRCPFRGFSSVPSFPVARRPAPDHPVDREVDNQDHQSQDDVKATRKRRWIYHGNKITLDKAGLIAGLSAQATQPILQRSEWAFPSCEFDQRRPHR